MRFDDEEEIINCVEVQTSNIAVAFARCRIYEMWKRLVSASAISYVPVCIVHVIEHVVGALNRTVRLPHHYRVNYVCSPCQWSAIISSSAALYWISRCLGYSGAAALCFNVLYHLLRRESRGIHRAYLIRSPWTTHKTLIHLWCSTYASAYRALARMIKAPAPRARVIANKPSPVNSYIALFPPVST